ncbi:YdcF family protein [Paraglaciecola sp. L3A3]|uniref:YdcF family protein n=1 Tax=Paraglaciecola sp. L3A3 TaxID=2686358 RepID=UPI00131E0427|nr:YdcF family protein [Paraglaciecola sp. L3A3]
MLSDIANFISSPLVHTPLLFVFFRILVTFNVLPKTCKWLSLLPIFWLYVCSLTYPSALMIKHLEDQYDVVSLDSNKWKQTDGIVVLACYYFEDDELPFVSHWPNCSLQRNLHASLMYKKYPLPIYLAGAVLGQNQKKSIAERNKSFFEILGVKSQDIITASQGRNTQAEAVALAPLLKGKRISLVTSASHMPRAVQYFEEQGLEVVPIPVEHMSNRKIEPMLGLPNARSLYRSERAIHEYLGLIYQNYLR